MSAQAQAALDRINRQSTASNGGVQTKAPATKTLGGGSSAGGGSFDYQRSPTFGQSTKAGGLFESNMDAAMSPIFSDSDIKNKYGARLRGAADASANQAIQGASQAMGGDTDSPFFQFLSSSVKAGAGADAATGLNDLQMQAAEKNRASLFQGISTLLQRLGVENAAESIKQSGALQSRGLDLQESGQNAQIAQNDRGLDIKEASLLASIFHPETDEGQAAYDVLGRKSNTSQKRIPWLL